MQEKRKKYPRNDKKRQIKLNSILIKNELVKYQFTFYYIGKIIVNVDPFPTSDSKVIFPLKWPRIVE